VERPGTTLNRSGRPIPVPRVVGRIRRRQPILLSDLRMLRANTDRMIKATVPGPFTMGKQAQDDFYGSEEAVALDYAAAVNAEIKDLFAAGADVVQIDEPWMQQHPDKAKAYGLAALDRALDGVKGTVAVHLCFGYAAVVHDKPVGFSFLAELEGSKAQQISIVAAQPRLDYAVLRGLPSKDIILGVIDLADPSVESPDTVADRIRRAVRHVQAERIVVAPDCGMKYLPRDIAFAKMSAMVEGAAIVRREIEAGAQSR
jgi:5-methyltetrahydropteroyltriglutamate--homocysteine methyltransferase